MVSSLHITKGNNSNNNNLGIFILSSLAFSFCLAFFFWEIKDQSQVSTRMLHTESATGLIFVHHAQRPLTKTSYSRLLLNQFLNFNKAGCIPPPNQGASILTLIPTETQSTTKTSIYHRSY